MSEHVYCMAMAFKMTRPVEQWICIKFCIKLERPSMETTWMIQATVMSNWWLAASSQQCAHSRVTSHAIFLVKYQITQVTQPPYGPDLAPQDLWFFPKLKSPLKGKRFQMVNEIQENMTRQFMATELYEIPRCLLWRELRLHYYVQYFFYLLSSSINVSIFHITWLGIFWIDLIYGTLRFTAEHNFFWSTHFPAQTIY